MDTLNIEGGDFPVEITLKTQLSRPALLALRQRIDELVEHLPEDSLSSTGASEDERAAAKAVATWQRLGVDSPTRTYLLACAGLAQTDREFTIDEVAAEMNEEHPRVLAYHRNVARSAAAAEPRNTSLLTSRRVGGRTYLHMQGAVSRTILELNKETSE